MKTIPLSKGKEAIVDDEDYEILMQWKWHFGHTYATRNSPKVNGKKKTIYMHCQIMNQPKGMEVDHISGNPLDNRRSNLRICTSYQNSLNKKLRSDNLLGLKGVSKFRNKYKARIKHKGKEIYIGYYFDTPEQAHQAYCEAALKIHGAFARTH